MGLTVTDLSYSYTRGKKTKPALKEVSLEFGAGEFTVIAGPAGSGKTTLIKHLNGILSPDSGRVTADGLKAQKKEVRKKVGMLFQHSGDQLFSETVYREIAFGPSNFGIKGKELEIRIKEALSLVHLAPEILDRSPFSLSGGEMRRVALAGVLALRPAYLVLDEPTAGLDSETREKLLSDLKRIQVYGTGIVVVTHDLDEFLPLADKVVLLKKGRLAFSGSPETYLQEGHSPAPQLSELMRLLNRKGAALQENVGTAETALSELLKLRLRLRLKQAPEIKEDEKDA